MVTFNVKKMMKTCSPMIEQFFDTMIVASGIKSGYNDPSKYKCWKLFWATLSVKRVGISQVEVYERVGRFVI